MNQLGLQFNDAPPRVHPFDGPGSEYVYLRCPNGHKWLAMIVHPHNRYESTPKAAARVLTCRIGYQDCPDGPFPIDRIEYPWGR